MRVKRIANRDMHNINELLIWKKSIALSVRIYELTSSFPSEERYGLISQIRRCGVSIASNIAEGAGRNTNGEFIHYLGIANGSAYELQTQIIISSQLKLINETAVSELLDQIDEIQKMCFKLQNAIRKKQIKY
jgi:four helix bundle protein